MGQLIVFFKWYFEKPNLGRVEGNGKRNNLLGWPNLDTDDYDVIDTENLTKGSAPP